MAFALLGTTITQTGTDINCSGLSAIAGVVTMTQGTEKTYNLGNLTLQISGTLSQDPDFEHLIFDSTNNRAHDIIVSGTGVWNLGVATTANGFTKYSVGNAVISQRAMPTSGTGPYILLEGSSVIYVTAGGTWNYRGGYIRSNHSIFIFGTGNFNMYAGRVQLVGAVRRFGLFSTGSVNLYGGTFDGVQFLISTIPTTFSGVDIIDTQSIVLESANNRSLTNVFAGLVLNGTGTDTRVWFSSYLEFRNSSKGSGLNIAGDNETTQGSYTGIVVATQNVTVSLANQAGAGIVGAATYIRDTNNGSRYSGFTTFDYTADRVYINSTGAGGITSTFNVLLGEVVKTASTQVRPFDIRGKTGVAGADLFDVYTFAYNYQPLPLSNAKLQSISTVALQGTMLADTYVTLTEANAVTKLASSFAVNTGTNTITVTANSTLDDLYDALKVYKTRAVQAQLEYPSIEVQPVTASGSVASTAMAITVNSGVALSTGTKLLSATAGTVTAELSSGGAYTYSGGTITAPMSNPTVTGGTLNLGGVGTYVFGMNAGIVNMTPAASGTYVMNNCTFSGTIDLRNTSAFPITVKVPNSATVITSNNTGGTITLDNAVAVTISAPNLLAGSRVRLYNVTDGVELYNDVLASAGLTFSYNWLSNKTITLTATYTNGSTAKLGLSATGVVTSSGLTFLNSQADDTVYNSYGINGSAVTGYSADYAQDDINLSMATNWSAANAYAWWIYTLTTENGIREFFGGITALDAANLQINTSIVSIFLDNSTALFIYQTDAIRLFRSDGVYPARTVTTGGGGIDVNWNSNVFIGDSPDLTLIKKNTDLIPALL